MVKLAKPVGRMQNNKILKPAGPQIDANGKNGETAKRAKMAKLVNGKRLSRQSR